MSHTEITKRAEALSLIDAREIKHTLSRKPTPLTDSEWHELLAAERVLAKAGELEFAFYNED